MSIAGARRFDALVVVDMQRMFVAAVGDRGPAVVAAVNALTAQAQARGVPVLFTRDVAPVELPPGDPAGVADLHPDVVLRGDVVAKGPGKEGGFSGFVLRHGAGPGDGALSELGGRLRAAGTSKLLVAGIAADVCVSATARDARRLGYDVTVPLGATAFVGAHPAGDEAAIADLRSHGVSVVDEHVGALDFERA